MLNQVVAQSDLLTDRWYRATVLTAVAWAFIDIGNDVAASATANRAYCLISGVSRQRSPRLLKAIRLKPWPGRLNALVDMYGKVDALQSLFSLLAMLNFDEKAREIANDLLSVILELDDAESKELLVTKVVALMVRVGSNAEAVRMIHSEFAAALRAGNRFSVKAASRVIDYTAKMLVQLGQREMAVEAANRELTRLHGAAPESALLRSIRESVSKPQRSIQDQALCMVPPITALIALGETERARDEINRRVDEFMSIESSIDSVSIAAARGGARLGKLDQALAAAAAIHEPYHRTQALEEIACAVAANERQDSRLPLRLQQFVADPQFEFLHESVVHSANRLSAEYFGRKLYEEQRQGNCGSLASDDETSGAVGAAVQMVRSLARSGDWERAASFADLTGCGQEAGLLYGEIALEAAGLEQEEAFRRVVTHIATCGLRRTDAPGYLVRQLAVNREIHFLRVALQLFAAADLRSIVHPRRAVPALKAFWGTGDPVPWLALVSAFSLLLESFPALLAQPTCRN